MAKKTYSKRRAQQSCSTSKYFTGSSSPIKPDSLLDSELLANLSTSCIENSRSHIIPPPDSPARNTRNQCKKRADINSAVHGLDNDDLTTSHIIDVSVEQLNPMGVMGRDDVANKFQSQERIDEKPAAARTILRSKDANAVNGRGKRPKGRKKDKEGFQLTTDVETLLSQFENLEVSGKKEKDTKAEDDHLLTPEKTSTSTARSRRTKPESDLSSCLRSQERVTAKQTHFSTYTQPLLSLCGDPAGRSVPTPFQDWADDLSQFFNIIKIAEASYGEVYRLSLQSPELGLASQEESVLKLIALKPPEKRDSNGDTSKTSGRGKPPESKKILAMSSVQDVASEVRLLRHLSPIPGFTNFREIRVLQGRLPHQFVAAWKDYNKSVKKSLFPDPARKTSYGEEQLWAVVEMQDAGTDVESLIEGLGNEAFVSVWTAWDVFWSVACAVAKGEEWTGFEHRDLHMGNICVRSDAGSILNPDTASLNLSTTIGHTRLETTLIDYTLSRANMSDTEDDVAFFDLSKDPTIFEGDSDVDYQYDMYRAMRSVVLHGNPAAKASGVESQGAWRASYPMTNLVWLHFILFKLMERVPEDGVVSHQGSQEADSLGRELRRRLERLEKVLDLQSLAGGDFQRSADLIGWAVDLGWLDEADVVGLNGKDKSELE